MNAGFARQDWLLRRQNTQYMNPSQATPPMVEKRSSPNDHINTAGNHPTNIHQIMLELLTTQRYPKAQ